MAPKDEMKATSSQRTRLSLALALACSLAAPRGQAAAQDGGTPDEPAPSAGEGARARATPLFRRGVELVEEQRWSEALEAFREASEVFPSPILVFDIAYCQRALGQFVLALEGFRRFLAMDQGVASNRADEARGYARELETRIGHLTVTLPAGLVSGLELQVDGQRREVTGPSLTFTLDPGRHTVQLRHEGYAPLFEDRDLPPGGEVRIDAQPHRLPGHIEVRATVEGARVLLDGEDLGLVPLQQEVEPGHHEVVVRADGYVPHRSVLDLLPGGTASVRATLSEEPVLIYEEWWFWTAIVAVVGGAAVLTWWLTQPTPEPQPYDGGSLGWVITP